MWLIGVFLLVLVFMLLAWRSAAGRADAMRRATAQHSNSDAALSQALAEAVTRLRGQELAQRARYDALDAFVQQIVEGVPAGVIVLSTQGHIRLANQWATGWLHVPEPVVGRVLWHVEGTQPLRELAEACLAAQARRDGVAAGPGDRTQTFPVSTIPLITAAGEVDGLMCLVHHERVS